MTRRPIGRWKLLVWLDTDKGKLKAAGGTVVGA